MSAASATTPSPDYENLLPVLLATSLAGVALLRPELSAEGELLDFTYIYLNPAAQHLLHLPERPAAAHQATYPGQAELFAFYRAAFESGQLAHHTGNYPHPRGGHARYLRVAAQRNGQVLVLSLTEADPPAATPAPPQPQLYALLHQAPAMICIFEGPEHRFEFVNPPYQTLVGSRPLVGRPIAEAMPELAGQPIFGLLDRVYRTGETFRADEMLVQLDHHNTGAQVLEERYYNFIYQARRTAHGAVNGILVFAYDVTPQVRARQQAAQQEQRTAQLNEALTATNAELAAANEKLLAAHAKAYRQNQALRGAQAELHRLNQELEARVADRTQALTQALRQAEQQRAQLQAQEQQLHQILSQVPAAVATLEGPEHRYSFVNARYQELVAQRAQLGLPLAEVLPELVKLGFDKLLDEVYATGRTLARTEAQVALHDPAKNQTFSRYVNFVYQPLPGAQGRPRGVLAFIVDVTESVLGRQRADAAQAQSLATAEQLARQRETHYRIFEQTPAAVAILRGPEHQLDYFNPAYERLFPPGSLAAGRPIAELQPEAVAHGFVALLDQVYATGETHAGYEHPLNIRQVDGQSPRPAYFDFTYQLFREDGQPAGISVFATEVTERVRARQQHEAQQQVLQRVFEQAPVAIGVFAGPDHVVEVCNPGLQAIWGRTAEQVLGRPLFDTMPEFRGQGFEQLLADVLRTGVPHVAREVPLRVLHQGEPGTVYVNFVYQPLRDAQGHITAVAAVATDISEQVRARQVVEQSEQYLRRMADAVPAMIWLTDAAGQCIYLNQQWHHYTGQAVGEGLGEGWLDVVHPDDLAGTRTIVFDATSQRAAFSVLYRQRRHDGRYRWVLDTGAPRFNRAGEFDGFVGTLFDIHEQKQAEQALQRLTTSLRTARDKAQTLNAELQASNEQLRRTNVDLDNFIYTASHDLKAPITNIEGLAHALHDQLPAQGPLAEAVAPLLAMMQDSIERFQRTLDHLSDVTKLQKEHDQPLAAVALAPVVAEVCLDLQPLLHASQAQLTTDVDSCPTVAFSAKNLRSVVYNLLSNALKYRDPARPLVVHIGCHAEGDYVVLRVQDNGLGLDDGQQAELFTMFRRFHVGVEGSGIGLYMVKKVVENAGGRLAVESQSGVGSVFSVYFRR